jgi:hypothetical protein
MSKVMDGMIIAEEKEQAARKWIYRVNYGVHKL